MADEPFEYTVRDYSAIDKQIDEIAKREGVLTNRLSIENIKKYALIGLLAVAGICALMLFAGIAYRIAFPPDSPKTIKEVIREVKVPVEVVKEVIKEVKVPVEVVKEVIKEVKVPVEVIKEVIREVRVPVENVYNSQQTNSLAGEIIKDNSQSYQETKKRLSDNNILYGNKVDVSLLWNNLNDLDLYIKCPDGELIYYMNRKSKNGGQLDIDRNVKHKEMTSYPIEHILWKDKAPVGKYEIILNLAGHHPKDQLSENEYQIIIDINNGTEIRKITGKYGKEKRVKKKVGEFYIKNNV